MIEEELIYGLRRRDAAALGALVDAYAAPVYALCSRVLAGAGGPPDVEECASDAFHAAWQRIDRYDPARAPFRTWLLMLAKYQALERRRALEKQHGAPGDAEAEAVARVWPEQELVSAEVRREIQAALAELAPVDRELVYRRYFLGERVDALAAALGLSRQAADNRLWRARRRLRERLGGEEVAGGEE